MMDFQTPLWVCNLMVGMIPKHCNSILEPTPGEGNLVNAMRAQGFNVYAAEDIWKVFSRFDAVVMNPPFTPMEQGYKILYRVMEMSDVIIALMPWLTIINSQKRTRDIIDYGLKSITHLPRNVFKGARVQTCVLEMKKGYIGDCFFITGKYEQLG